MKTFEEYAREKMGWPPKVKQEKDAQDRDSEGSTSTKIYFDELDQEVATTDKNDEFDLESIYRHLEALHGRIGKKDLEEQ
jgi:hypothetical protein